MQHSAHWPEAITKQHSGPPPEALWTFPAVVLLKIVASTNASLTQCMSVSAASIWIALARILKTSSLKQLNIAVCSCSCRTMHACMNACMHMRANVAQCTARRCSAVDCTARKGMCGYVGMCMHTWKHGATFVGRYAGKQVGR